MVVALGLGGGPLGSVNATARDSARGLGSRACGGSVTESDVAMRYAKMPTKTKRAEKPMIKWDRRTTVLSLGRDATIGP